MSNIKYTIKLRNFWLRDKGISEYTILHGKGDVMDEIGFIKYLIEQKVLIIEIDEENDSRNTLPVRSGVAGWG